MALLYGVGGAIPGGGGGGGSSLAVYISPERKQTLINIGAIAGDGQTIVDLALYQEVLRQFASYDVGSLRAGTSNNDVNALMAASLQRLLGDRWDGVASGDMKVGEIVAWRCWREHRERLFSCHTPVEWLPGEPMTGDPRRYGVHAWKTYGDAMDYGGSNWVVGSCALWGDVVEHERGYRASFGRPLTFQHYLTRDGSKQALPRQDEFARVRLVMLRRRWFGVDTPNQITADAQTWTGQQ